MHKLTIRRLPIYVCVGLFLGLWLFVSLVPFYLSVITSLKSNRDWGLNSVFAFPERLMFENYLRVIGDGILINFRNSLIVVSIALAALLVISLCAAYPLSRLRFKLNRPIFLFIVASMAIPMHVTLIPIYLLTLRMGIFDTFWALILPYIAFNIPITVFILTNFMKSIPREIEEAAEIDGCSKMRVFVNIITPLSSAGVVTVAIFNAVAMWNEFSFALVLMQTRSLLTLPLAVWNYRAQYHMDVPLIFVVVIFSVVPMIIAYAIGQDKLVKGMIAGAIKG